MQDVMWVMSDGAGHMLLYLGNLGIRGGMKTSKEEKELVMWKKSK